LGTILRNSKVEVTLKRKREREMFGDTYPSSSRPYKEAPGGINTVSDRV